MDWIEIVWQQVATYVCVPYLLTFLLLSYLIKRDFRKLLDQITGQRWRTVYTVLIIATIMAVPFLLFSDYSWVQILFSYTLGTSLHELIFKWIDQKIVKWLKQLKAS